MIESFRILSGALPFASTLAWAAVFRFCSIHGLRGWRWSLTLACVQLGVFVLVLTESLSAFHLLDASAAFVIWSLYLIIPAGILLRSKTRIDIRAEAGRLAGKLGEVPLWILGSIALLGVVTLLMAVFTPPMNFDVQCYHLPRQVFWLMEGSIRHFDATYSYQNSQPVLCEFLGLNLFLLSGGDHWHNLVQWGSFIAACGLITLITQAIGGNARAQALAVLFVALLPVAFFEASNAKNDVAVAFFLMIPVLIGIRFGTETWSPSVSLLLLAALAAGLAMATKGTSIAYLPPAAILITAGCLRRGGLRVLVLALIPGILIASLPLAPVVARNFATYHSIGGETAGLMNASHAPKSVLGVAIKNLANQFAFGSCESILSLETRVRTLLENLGVDPDEPETTIPAPQLGGTKLKFFYFVGCEDIIPAPVQTGLCLMLPLMLLVPAFRKRPGVMALALTMFGSFILFCVIFRWQPWGGRLLIPEYFMAAPLLGSVGAILPRWIPIVSTLLAFGFLQNHFLSSGQRHIEGGRSIFAVSKDEQISMAMPGRAEEIRDIVELLRARKVRGVLINGGVSPIYGLLREIRILLPDASIKSTSGEDGHHGEAIVELAEVRNPLPKGFKNLYKGHYYQVALKDSHP